MDSISRLNSGCFSHSIPDNKSSYIIVILTTTTVPLFNAMLQIIAMRFCHVCIRCQIQITSNEILPSTLLSVISLDRGVFVASE